MSEKLVKYVVEFLGTMFCLHTVLFTGGNALAIGASFALAITLAQNISGGNLNPAVTIMLSVANKLPLSDVAPYVIAQVAGGLAAIYFYNNVTSKIYRK